MVRTGILTLLTAMIACNAFALELNRTFSDNMVLQRDKPLVIRGTADGDAKVTVSFAGQSKTGRANSDGVWAVTLDAVAADNSPRSLTASTGRDRVTIKNVLVGDVILHARQTSIDISLGRNKEGIKAASSHRKNPMLRAISVKTIPSAKPLNDLSQDATTGWSVVDKDSALAMMASAYYLGRDLVKSVDVPIGIIDVNMGYAFPNSWLSREALLKTGEFYDDRQVAQSVENYDKILEAEVKGEKLREQDDAPPENTVEDTLFPAGGYNGTLCPLAGTAMKAVVVQLGNDYPYMIYQKLLDSGTPFDDYSALDRAYKQTYLLRKGGFQMESKTVPRIPRQWRKALGDEDLPFGLIIPPGSDLNTLGQHHREMRELQRLTAEENLNVGIILPGTAHIPFSAQPADDAMLGKRSLSWIEGAVYNRPETPATGPMFDRLEASFNEATIHFKTGTAKGLKAEGNALDYFEAANVEGAYYPARATIDGDTVRIKSDSVSRIARVRYNWNQRPNQGLVNGAGLPTIPFRTERAEYHWLIKNEDEDLPEEYFMPANEWEKNDVTLINVSLQGKGYDNFTGWVGPAGFHTGPFGPNMGVREIKEGSPADGKLFVGDMIYSANGKMLGNKAWLVMAAAVTESETREGNGKLILGVRRGAENINIELTLPVMGTYSSTAPYDCPKTEKIVSNLAEWVSRGGDANERNHDFLGADTLFLLATGNPEYMGLARRAIYKKLAETDIVDEIDPTKGPKAWYPAWDAMLLGEYYLATGDRNVLPYLKFNCDLLAAKQHPLGSWRHNYPGGDTYGLMPALGIPAAIGFNLANDAGLDISQDAYRKVVKYYHDGQAEMGQVIYGVSVSRAKPPEFEPDKINNGKMSTYNGAVGSAAVLYSLEGNTRTAHLCSVICARAWNNTFEGHGGNFWNNFWTPLGARVQGRKSFINFWKHHRWYRELSRMHDGRLIGGGRDSAGYGVALAAPRKRLQIVGAPPSPFAANAPAILKPALDAYWKKNYAGCEKLVNELLASGTVGLDEKPTAEYLGRAAKEMQESIDVDFKRMQTLIDAGDLSEAKTFLAGLEGVVPAGDERLITMQKTLADVRAQSRRKKKEKTESTEKPRQWVCLVMESETGDSSANRGSKRGPVITSKQQEPNLWKLKVVESSKQAPEGWIKPKFDDSGWLETTLPKSWHMYHTALMRTRFKVEDKNQFDALRLHSWILRQQGVEIYLNGELIGKINGAQNSTHIEQKFKASALKHLKNGENTLAIKTRHNWRWGHGALRVYNDGFDFNLDARLKNEE